MKYHNPFLSILALTAALLTSAAAEPKSEDQKGHEHGPMSGDFRGVIHSLFAAHDEVERAVTEIENGYEARTTSDNPEVAAMLQKHVSQMASRLEGGAGVRKWDPAFVELREHYRDMAIEVQIKNITIAVVLALVKSTFGRFLKLIVP